MTDNDKAWEKAERERAQEAMKTQCPPKGDSHDHPFVAGWMVKAREAKTIHASKMGMALRKIDDLDKQLTAVTKGCAKAYDLLKDRNDCDADMDDNDSEWNRLCDEWIAAWQLTLPAEEKEADHAD